MKRPCSYVESVKHARLKVNSKHHHRWLRCSVDTDVSALNTNAEVVIEPKDAQEDKNTEVEDEEEVVEVGTCQISIRTVVEQKYADDLDTATIVGSPMMQNHQRFKIIFQLIWVLACII
ncbi:hypothetical protein RND81_03G123700 [Saponaria officinalis]|uniref:Uncharacterized protein n=1 Tax=Saponaria officinalis TaxID=3572 RepID=A0AAW1M7L3_SAPOF